MSWPLPTPGEAMQAAVEAAQRGDIEGGNLWLGIARELRVGAAAERLAHPPRLLDGRADVGREGPPEVVVPADNGYAGEHAAERFERIAVPVPEPVYRSDETLVLNDFELPRCAYCDHALLWVAPGPDNPEQDPYWAHQGTGQRVCPTSVQDQPHTFATPMADARG